jgi:hypothetical protein
MGYSSPVVHITVYAHKINDTDNESACGLEEIIFGKMVVKQCHKKKKGLHGLL